MLVTLLHYYPHLLLPPDILLKKINSDVDGDKYNFYQASPWTLQGKKFCDVFILLPSGLHDNDAYEVRIADCGTFLNLGITWPKALSDLTTVMKIARLHDTDVSMSHPMLVGVTEFHKTLKASMYSDVEKNYVIPLPFQVQSDFCFINCVRPVGFDRNGKGATVYLRVQGHTDSYANSVRASGKISSLILFQ